MIQAAMDTLRASGLVPTVDTIYVSDSSNVSAWTAVGVALLTLCVVFWQAKIYKRQADIMDSQAQERRREAVGTFYRAAYDLVDEFRKADGIRERGDPLPVNYETHPRQVLRGASHVFAPLSNRAVMALNQVGRGLDIYFEQALSWNQLGVDNRLLVRQQSLNEARRRVGEALDEAHAEIPKELRYSWVGESRHLFREICSHPSARTGEVAT